MRLPCSDDLRFERRDWGNWRTALRVGAAYCVSLVMISLLAAAPCRAASIPAWLDDAITQWNKLNPTSQIQFVAIKDQYVWYTMSAQPELGSKEIRERVYGIVHKNGYANMNDEESVTTATPPSPNGPVKAKKCWNRSFLRNIQGSSTPGESMLTTLVCEDGANWSVGFRIL
jgi:hypothetical protein